ncbi:hypothetical protein GCM10010116_59760 [Microbispora rosea subsp. aerata]|nr:hypothetical protein GCM10010116_59760 [Microbispora rosea subsp. aerata]GIH58994.1 hypothetical protein Mro02_59080 [Microbispora rosea subsp. aerata]GLJ82124.1 hypothetical protein GCM10017588_08490 [Microbispora rosea subsp. aerata]
MTGTGAGKETKVAEVGHSIRRLVLVFWFAERHGVPCPLQGTMVAKLSASPF